MCLVAVVLFLVWPEEASNPVETPPALALPAAAARKAGAPPPPRQTVEPVAQAVDAEPEPVFAVVEYPDEVADAVVESPRVIEPAPSLLPARRITSLGDDRLDFAFSGECWVEVKDETGRNLYSDLSRAGDDLSLVGRGPFRILLGFGPAVTLAVNGEPVALAAHTRNNVASLVVARPGSEQ
ncbi:MAG: DUF4115 domain-containing protein [Gammaproteobacteria bacterium]|nr:DUF4115 domain-containing protein [Gammaproteobacteria bacterium]